MLKLAAHGGQLFEGVKNLLLLLILGLADDICLLRNIKDAQSVSELLEVFFERINGAITGL